ncbi:DUF4231 domain-containing protein [Kribbella sp. NPDC058693]|uniref:DUF4231 domain-containing protein n=1 Tax=Kribbella sp. NPDC058693 TaxID=3346602 RepID=UPI00364E8224
MAEGRAEGKAEKVAGQGGLLEADMKSELAAWERATKVLGLTYRGLRVFLIIASAIVAAEASLRGSEFAWLAGWTPILALLVAILTAIDTWLKPQQKWRGVMESRDDLKDLLASAEGETDRRDIQIRFAALRKRHREANVD